MNALRIVACGGKDMIRVVDRTNRHQFIRSLEQQFRLRHEIFVKERGWKEFDREGIYEKDQYDDDHASYLISIDEKQNVIGSSRIYPTARPHMLSEQFAALVDGAVPQRADLLEFTRLAICKRMRGSGVYNELFIGLQEYCLERGFSGATTLVRSFRIPVVRAAGMNVAALGPSREIDGEMCTAILIEASAETVLRMRRIAGISGTVMESNLAPVRKIA